MSVSASPLIPPSRLTRAGAWLSLTLIGLISVLPFLQSYHFAPLQTFYEEWLALALGVSACLGFLSRQFWSRIEVPHVALYCLALAAITAIQGAIIPYSYIAQILMPGIYLMWAILLMVLGVWLRTVFGIERVATISAWFLFSGGLLASFTGLVQYLGIGGWLGEFVVYKTAAAVYGNIAQSNLFATHVTIGAAAAMFLFSREKLSTPLTVALIAFFAFIVTLSGSRAVALYILGIVAISAIGYLKIRDKTHLRLLSMSGYLFIAFLCWQFLLIVLNPWLTEHLADISLNSNPFVYSKALDKLPATYSGLELRVSEARKAWAIFTQAPFLGVGFGNYAWHSYDLQALPEFRDVLKPQLFSHTHNIFTQLLAETGIIGISIFIFLIFGWVKQFRQSQPSSHIWLIGSALLVLFIHSNLEYPLWYSFFLGIAAFLLGLGDTRTIQFTFSPNLGRTAVVTALMLIGSTMIMTFVNFRQITELPNPRVKMQEQINMLMTYGRNPILNPYTDIVLVGMMPTTKDAIKEKLTISTRVFHRNPDWYKAYKQTTFLALNGQVAEAESLLNKIALTYPNNFLPYLTELKKLPDPEIEQIRKFGENILASKQ
jgi:O-antigen ligase